MSSSKNLILPPKEILDPPGTNPNYEYIILWMLKNNEYCEWREFKEESEIPESTLSNYINDLISKEFIDRFKRGHYKITSEGRSRFNEIIYDEELGRTKLVYPPKAILRKRNYEHWILWMLYNNEFCKWSDFRESPLSINQSSLSKSKNFLIDKGFIKNENKEYYITSSGKIEYFRMLKTYDLDRQSILEEESKRIEEITKRTNEFYDKYEIVDDDVKFRFLNNTLKMNYSKVENMLDGEEDFNKILLFLSMNHPDQYPEYMSPQAFAKIYDIKQTTLDFFIEKIVDEELYPVKFFRLEVFPDKEYYFQANEKLERILRAIIDDYITKHTYLDKLAGQDKRITSRLDVSSLLNNIINEICGNLFVDELKDSLRKFLPIYIKDLAYKIETEKKLISEDARREGFIWQNIFEEFQSFKPSVTKQELKEDIYHYSIDYSIFKALDVMQLNISDFVSILEFKKIFEPDNASIVDEINELFSKGKISKIKSVYNKYYEKFNELEDLIVRDLVATNTQDLTESIRLSEELIRKYPKLYIGYLFKSISLFSLLEFDEAYYIINEGLEVASNTSLLCEKAYILIYKDEYEKAVKLIDDVLESDSQNFLALKTKIITIMYQKNCCYLSHEEDFELIDKIIKLNPRDKQFYILKAILLSIITRYKEAKKIIKRDITINLFDKNPKLETAASFILIYSYLAQGKFNKASEIGESVYKRHSDHPIANLSWAIVDGYDLIYNFSGAKLKPDKFLTEIEISISQDQNVLNQARYYDLKSIVLEQIGMRKEAIEAIDNAIELVPVILDYKKHKSWILFRSERPSESLTLLDKLIEEFPQEEAVLLKLKSFIAFEIEDVDLGLEVCSISLEKYPDDYSMLNNKAIFLAELNRIDEALEAGRKLVSHAPDDGNYHDTYGEVLMKAGQYKDAIKELETAIELKPTAWYVYDTYTKLGICHRELGYEEEAISYFDRAEKIKSKKLPSERRMFGHKS
ncbi:MAG: tetratricopeptide repeat protein [Candidatus Thorarchaeota archaeon]